MFACFFFVSLKHCSVHWNTIRRVAHDKVCEWVITSVVFIHASSHFYFFFVDGSVHLIMYQSICRLFSPSNADKEITERIVTTILMVP